jgi:hypothetical protein
LENAYFDLESSWMVSKVVVPGNSAGIAAVAAQMALALVVRS